MSAFLSRIVVDTNILFMSLYNPLGKCAQVINLANEGKIELFAPESVKKEILRVLGREMSNLTEAEREFITESFPIVWVENEIYESFLVKTKVRHKADKPVEALALALNCGILSADKGFEVLKNKLNIDALIRSVNSIEKKG